MEPRINDNKNTSWKKQTKNFEVGNIISLQCSLSKKEKNNVKENKKSFQC